MFDISMVNALLVQTYFNPDEHWQALEVAQIAYGYVHLTWEWSKGIHSYLHPMVFVLLYKLIGFFHLDSPLLMAKAPRVLQSIFSVVEFRFVSPVLPITLMFSGYSFATLEKISCLIQRRKRKLWLIRGTGDGMTFLAKEALVENKVKNILFLMPCHSTPYFLTLYRNVSMRFLDCTPSDENKGVPDESDRFMMDQLEKVEELLGLHSFREVERFFHAHFKVGSDSQAFHTGVQRSINVSCVLLLTPRTYLSLNVLVYTSVAEPCNSVLIEEVFPMRLLRGDRELFICAKRTI
ncbi:hypothetical protein ACHQM5_029422 [Ranunculus cassubicifolius]